MDAGRKPSLFLHNRHNNVDLDNEGNGTKNRYKKDSFYWYKKVIASNGEDLE